MQTRMDAEIVGWIGRIGAASAEHVIARFVMSRTRTYARLSRLVVSGLLEQRSLLYRQPGLYVGVLAVRDLHGLDRQAPPDHRVEAFENRSHRAFA